MKAITENGTTITLEDKHEIKRGGEGKILTIPELPQHVAKIYLDPNYQHMSKAQKDALSVLETSFFVKPVELIFDKKKNTHILGFTMEYLPPDFLPLSAFFNKNFCATHQIDNNRKTLIARRLIQAVQSAHQKNIIIGDLSGLNVMANVQGEVKFLDVDSYETPVHSHWGMLLDEIRDYLFQGVVSEKSDYFALSILIFSLFTHLHPFKGIHKLHKAMSERMIRKIPVFANDPDLIIPKCYTPLQNDYLQKQFGRIFLEGERFLVSIDQVIQTVTRPVKTPTTLIKTNLKYQEIYQLRAGEFIQKAGFSASLGYIATNQQVLLYDVSNQGYTTLKKAYPKSPNSLFEGNDIQFFIGNKHFFILKESQLLVRQEGEQFLPISNFKATSEAQYFMVGSILVVLDEGYMRYLHLDQVIGNQIHIEQTPVFTAGFDVFNGLIQNVGGVQYVFYASGHTISSVRSPRLLKAVRIIGNVGLAVYEEQLAGETSLKHTYFKIDNLQLKLSNEGSIGLNSFTYKAQTAQKGLIFEPADDCLKVRNSEDFAVIAEMDCSLLSTESNLVMTQAGIIAYEKDFCFLLNTQ